MIYYPFPRLILSRFKQENIESINNGKILFQWISINNSRKYSLHSFIYSKPYQLTAQACEIETHGILVLYKQNSIENTCSEFTPNATNIVAVSQFPSLTPTLVWLVMLCVAQAHWYSHLLIPPYSCASSFISVAH